MTQSLRKFLKCSGLDLVTLLCCAFIIKCKFKKFATVYKKFQSLPCSPFCPQLLDSMSADAFLVFRLSLVFCVDSEKRIRFNEFHSSAEDTAGGSYSLQLE